MQDMTWLGWVVSALSAFLIGVSKTGLPGVGILGILLSAAVLPARASTGLILPMLIVGDLFAVAYYRRHAVWGHLVKLLPCAAAGIVAGWWVMHFVNDNQLKTFIGAAILAMIALSWWRSRGLAAVNATAALKSGAPAGGAAGLTLTPRERVPAGLWFPVCIGLAAGMTTMMANAAGPIMIVYLVAMRLPKNEFLGTGAWYYLILNCFKVPFSAGLGLVNPQSLQYNLILLPLIVAGALGGVYLAKKVPQKAFTTLVQALALLFALWLVVSPLVMGK